MADDAFTETLARLSLKSRSDYYNPYTRFSWPTEVPTEGWWMSPEYLTVHGTGLVEDENVLRALARQETINLFSLHVHGIRDLISAVCQRMHTPGFSEYDEYLHHFIGEENSHMWFFAEFCDRYAGGLHPPTAFPLRTDSRGDLWDDVATFARVLVFEEIFDFYNSRMGRDPRLPAILRDIHAAHHHDESRHVAFGKPLVRRLHERARETDPGRRDEIERHIKGYMSYSVRSLYSPQAFRGAGVLKPLETRRRAMAHPARRAFHARALARVNRYFVTNGILQAAWEDDDAHS